MVDTGRLKDLTEMRASIIAGIRKSRGIDRLINSKPGETIYSKDNMFKLRNTTVFCNEVA